MVLPTVGASPDPDDALPDEVVVEDDAPARIGLLKRTPPMNFVLVMRSSRRWNRS
jgi:hypothetical protein